MSSSLRRPPARNTSTARDGHRVKAPPGLSQRTPSASSASRRASRLAPGVPPQGVPALAEPLTRALLGQHPLRDARLPEDRLLSAPEKKEPKYRAWTK